MARAVNPAFMKKTKQCPNCPGVLRGVGTTRGEVWTCPSCGYIDSPDTREEVKQTKVLCPHCQNRVQPDMKRKRPDGKVSCPNCGVLFVARQDGGDDE